MKKITSKLSHFKIGDQIHFKDDNAIFIVRALKGNFIFATTINTGKQYTIIDIDAGICGPTDRVINTYDFKKQEDIEKCLDDLINGAYGGMYISERHRASVEDVINI